MSLVVVLPSSIRLPHPHRSLPTRFKALGKSAVLIATLPLAGALHALPEDSDKPIHIVGKTAEMDRQAKTLIYRGDVRIDQGTLRVVADTMVVEYEADQVVRITATGSPARYQQQLEDNQGHVHANAREIVYHTQTEALDLKGKAHLLQRGSELKGDVVRYDIVGGKVDAHAASRGPVRMILQPARQPR